MGNIALSPRADIPWLDADMSTYYLRDSSAWLCHPRMLEDDGNVCLRNTDATAVYPDGTALFEPNIVSEDPLVDCFYVYPTISADPTPNSDLNPGFQERHVTFTQAARYSSVCRVFAPVYRQATIRSRTKDLAADTELAYQDVLAAFQVYMEEDNDGRGFILLGHSQGSSILERLLDEEIEEDPLLLEGFVSAHLIGASPESLQVAKGSDIGGSFDRIPVCRAPDEFGCVIGYSSFRDTDPFLLSGEVVYGKPRSSSATDAVCALPGATDGGSLDLVSYFPRQANPVLAQLLIIRAPPGPFADPELFSTIKTPFYTVPGFLTAECRTDANGFSNLVVQVHSDPDDARAKDFNAEFRGGDGWGLHFADITIALGNLVDLAEQQAAAWWKAS